MIVRINLLPHREERRRRARAHFATLAGMTAALGAAIVGAVYILNERALAEQQERNAFLKSEIAKLDKEIEEIKKLKDEIAALLARKQVIEALQADRAQTVYLLDELVRQMPDGVFLKSMKQKGLAVELTGYAQSNARVSALMRNIESSQWLANPQLVEIKAANLGKMRVSEFNLRFALKRAARDEGKDAKGAPKAAGKG
ncbi:MAG: PilN domain-containing protein [Burkholderiales bacterium]|nr:PilN domain-containing protein [Burkholderiales bacterium]